MSDPVDQEIEAIRSVLAALQPLSEKARATVLDYIMRRLEIRPSQVAQPDESAPSDESKAKQLHIKELKDQKKPRSANEMAAVVAYYLANVAPISKRKQTVTHKDIETQFKIAGFPLPGKPRATLPNARNAGYFDSAGSGEYKLNPVGHNLVVHSMPRGASAATAGGRRKRKKRTGKPKKKPAASRKTSKR